MANTGHVDALSVPGPESGLTLTQVYETLLRGFGPQHWWPADSRFEMMVGAILTQNTAWTNVEQAIAQLRANDCLDPDAILVLTRESLGGLIRSTGYFNVKARRLASFCRWYRDQGGYEALSGWTDQCLRKSLLAVHGVGPETADDMMLYAFDRPVFVVDTYTRRLFSRLGLVAEDMAYEGLRAFIQADLKACYAESLLTTLYGEFHALIVAQGKSICRPKPRCQACRLRAVCPAAQVVSA